MITVLLGGARSGKSALAVEIGRRSAMTVVYIATSPHIAGDDDLDDRIARHVAERPSDWTTIEEDLLLDQALRCVADDATVIVDCLTTWLGNQMYHGRSSADVEQSTAAAIEVARSRRGSTIVISNEVGWGIVPADATTREYRDMLGRVNQRWVTAADSALLLVAGRAVPLVDPWIALA